LFVWQFVHLYKYRVKLTPNNIYPPGVQGNSTLTNLADFYWSNMP